MVKNYTFKSINTNNSNGTTKTINFPTEPNYSKILDSIIATNIIATNPYLKKYATATKPSANTSCAIECPLKKNSTILAALNNIFIPKNTFEIKVDEGKTFNINGHLITFFDDEIVIDGEIFSIDSFINNTLFKSLAPQTKKTFIDIYTKAGTHISIAA